MDGETFLIDPNSVVVFGFRSVLSMIGLTLAVGGYWMMEHRWDNEGAAAMRRRRTEQPADQEATQNKNINVNSTNDNISSENNDNYVSLPDPPSQTSKARDKDTAGAFAIATAAEMILCGQIFHESGSRELVRVGTYDSHDASYHPPRAAAAQDPDGQLSATAAQYYNAEPSAEFQARLATAFPLPIVLLVGCGVWSISFFLDPSIGGFRLYANAWNVLSFLLAALVGPIIAYPIRQATLERDIHRKKKACWSLLACLFLLTVMSIADPRVENTNIWYINVFGVLFILASYPILQRVRRMGVTWDWEGKPKSSSEVLVQNLGTPLLFWGILLFWIGTNAVSMADLNQTYLPIWTNFSRSWCVFMAAMVLIVPAHLALDLAFDQGSQPIVLSECLSLYTLDGSTFSTLLESVKWVPSSFVSTVLESPIWLSLGWVLMALSCFLPFGITQVTVQQVCGMSICLVIAPIYGLFVLPTLWKSDMAGFTRWSYGYYGLMILWATTIGINGGIALLLSVMGVLLVLIGHRWDLYERKRGIPWLNTDTSSSSTLESISPTTSPQVYGVGQPLHAVGWLLLCLAMSIPM